MFTRFLASSWSPTRLFPQGCGVLAGLYLAHGLLSGAALRAADAGADASAKAEAGEVTRVAERVAVNLNFAQAQAGVVPDAISPTGLPLLATVPAYTVYGRLRSASAVPTPGVQVAGPAMGRRGVLDALRLGDEGEGLRGINYRFEDGQPFTMVLWLSVYDVRTYFYGSLLVTPPGPVHGGGFSLGFQRAKWSKEGWIEFRWGKGVGSDGFWHHGFAPGRWHQLVITSTGTEVSLYVDGALSMRREARLTFGEGGQELVLGQREPSRRQVAVDFKTDEFWISREALAADEVNRIYDAGAALIVGEVPVDVSADVPDSARAARLAKARTEAVSGGAEARLLAMRLEIPHGSYGYFPAGTAIPILVDQTGDADELIVNGRSYALPLEAPVSVTYTSVGFETIDLAVRQGERVLKQVTYPVAITRFDGAGLTSAIGAADMAASQPEARALGLSLDRIVVDWTELEPEREAYNWTRLDAEMKRSRELGAQTVLCLTGLPKWMARQPGSANLPADLARFTKLWRILASRYDDATAYEVWDSTAVRNRLRGSESQRLADYLTLLQAASPAIRRERPDATILAGRVNVDDAATTATFLESNAPQLFDVFSVGAYVAPPAEGEARSAWVTTLRAATGKPIWNTASGRKQVGRLTLLPAAAPPNEALVDSKWPTSATDEWTGAAWQIQDLARQLAGGVQRVILNFGPSLYEPPSTGSIGLPGIKGVALTAFNGITGGEGATFSLAAEQKVLPAEIAAIHFTRSDGVRGILLFSAGEVHQVGVDALDAFAADGQARRFFDMLGKPFQPTGGQVSVSSYPIYFLFTQTLDTH